MAPDLNGGWGEGLTESERETLEAFELSQADGWRGDLHPAERPAHLTPMCWMWKQALDAGGGDGTRR